MTQIDANDDSYEWRIEVSSNQEKCVYFTVIIAIDITEGVSMNVW